MGKNLYLNDVPVDVFLDYFDKTTYAEENVNEQVWEESDTIVLKPIFTPFDNNSFEIKSEKNNKINQNTDDYYKFNFEFSNDTINNISLDIDNDHKNGVYTKNEIENVFISLEADTDVKTDIITDIIEKITNFSFTKLENLFETYYNYNKTGGTLKIAIKAEPYKVPKVNDKGENIYRDAQGLLTTKASYDNNFFTHQKALRRAFAGLTENNSWMYRCNPRTLSILSDKGKEYLAYYDQCIKTTKYEEINEISEDSPVSSAVLPKKATTGNMNSKELLKIENRVKNLTDYPVYSVYSTAKDAPLLEAASSFYLEDKRYVCRESGFYEDGVENPDYIYKLDDEHGKVELANKNLYFMNASGFYSNNEKIDHKEGSQIVFANKTYTYQEPGFYTKDKDDIWTKKLGLKTGTSIILDNGTILTYFNDGFFKLKNSVDTITTKSEVFKNLLNNNEYNLANGNDNDLKDLSENEENSNDLEALSEEENIGNDIKGITYNDIDGWTWDKDSKLIGETITLYSAPTKVKITNDTSNRVFTWKGNFYESILNLETDVNSVEYQSNIWNINFSKKYLQKTEPLKITTLVIRNGRIYKFNGSNFVTEPINKYLPKNVKVQYNGDEYEWTGKKLRRLLLLTVKPELSTKIIYNGKTYTWSNKGWNGNIPNKAKVKYNGEKDWKWYANEGELDKIFRFAKKPEVSTVVSYKGLNYTWNGSNFVLTSKDEVILENNHSVIYRGVQGWKYNSSNNSLTNIFVPRRIGTSNQTIIAYKGNPYFFDGTNFRNLKWEKLPSDASFIYNGLDGWKFEDGNVKQIITAETAPPIKVEYKNISFVWNGEKFNAEKINGLTLPKNAKVKYNGINDWVVNGKLLVNTVNFYDGISVKNIDDDLIYTYNKKTDLFINRKTIDKNAVNNGAYSVLKDGISEEDEDEEDSWEKVNALIIPHLPSVVIDQYGKKKQVGVDSFTDGEIVTYKKIDNYVYSNGTITHTINLELGYEVTYNNESYVFIKPGIFKKFEVYKYNNGTFYNINGDELNLSNNPIYLLNNSSIYQHLESGFYDNALSKMSLKNGNKIKSNSVEYTYFSEPGFYRYTIENAKASENPTKLDLVPGMSIAEGYTAYIYRTGWLFYKDKYSFIENDDIITFKGEEYKYLSKGQAYIPANYFYEIKTNKQLKLYHNMIIKKDNDYFLYHEDDKCFYKRSPTTLGSIIYSPEMAKRGKSLSENIFAGVNPKPEMVLLNVYDRTFKIKNKNDWKLKLNDDDTVYIYPVITDTESGAIKENIELDGNKNCIFNIKSDSPYLLIVLGSNRDNLLSSIDHFLHIEIPASESPNNESTLILNGKITGDSLNAASVKLDFGGDFEASVLTASEVGISEEQKKNFKNFEECYFAKIDLEKIECRLCRQMLCEISKAKETKIQNNAFKVFTNQLKNISYKVARTIVNGISSLFFSSKPPIMEPDETYSEVVCTTIPIIGSSDKMYRITDCFKIDFSNEPIERFYNLVNPSQEDINNFLKFGREKLNNQNLSLEGSIFKEEEYFENYYSIESPYIKKTTTYQFLKSSNVLMLDDMNDTVLNDNLEWNLKEDLKGDKPITVLSKKIDLEKVTEVLYKNQLYKWDGNNFRTDSNHILNKNVDVGYVETVYKSNKNEVENLNSKTFVDDNKVTYYWNGLNFINTRDIREDVVSLSYGNFDGWKFVKNDNKISISGIEIPDNTIFDDKYLYKNGKFYNIAVNSLAEVSKGTQDDIYLKKSLIWNGQVIKETLTPKDKLEITYNNEVYYYSQEKKEFINITKNVRIRTVFKMVYNILNFFLKSLGLEPIDYIEEEIIETKLPFNANISINDKTYRYIAGILDRDVPLYELVPEREDVPVFMNGGTDRYIWNSSISNFVRSSEISMDSVDFNGITGWIIDEDDKTFSNTIDCTEGMKVKINNLNYTYIDGKFVTSEITSDIPDPDIDVTGSKTTQILVNNKNIYSYDGENFVNEKNEILPSSEKFFEVKNGYTWNYENKTLNDIKLTNVKKYNVFNTNNKTWYIWDGITFKDSENNELEIGTANLKYLMSNGYTYNKTDTDFYLEKTKVPSLTTRIKVDNIYYDWDGEKFVSDEPLPSNDEITIMSTYENGWSWNAENKTLTKNGKNFNYNLSTLIFCDEKIYHYNGSTFVRKIDISDIDLMNATNIAINNDPGYSWNGFQLIKKIKITPTSATKITYDEIDYSWNGESFGLPEGTPETIEVIIYNGEDGIWDKTELIKIIKITPTLATSVIYNGLTYTWDGYQFSFGDLDKYPCTKQNPEFNNLDIEGLPITKETIQQRYNHAGRYFVNEVSQLRGDYIQPNVFFKDRVNSLTKIIKNIIENDEGEIQLKTESMKSNGFTNLYNYCQGLNNFVKKDVSMIGDVQIPERLLIDPKEIYMKLILENVNYTDGNPSTSNVSNVKTKNILTDERSILERISQYKVFPANFMYENYLNSINTDVVNFDRVVSNVNIMPGYTFEKQRHIKDYRQDAFNDILDNIFGELKEFIKNGDKENHISRNNLNEDSEYFNTFYKSKLNHLKKHVITTTYKDAINEKKVFVSSNDEIELILLNLMKIDNENIWEVLYGIV